MNRFEHDYYNDISSIEKSLKRIANALENNNKENKIYYKTRKDMFMDNPCTKEEYEASKQEVHNVKHAFTGMDGTQIDNIPGFEGTLDALDNLCNIGTNPKNDPEKDKFDDDDDIRKTARMYDNELLAGNFKTKKECILDYITNEFGSQGARYTDIIKFAYYLGAPNASKFNSTYNRGYYACAISGRNAHLIQGGEDFLVKGINKEGDERYFAKSFVQSVTDYWKYIEGGTHGRM